MNHKSCKKINDSFVLSDKFEPSLAVRNHNNEIIKRVPITAPIEKGYIYASLFFYDEVSKEIEKLKKLITKIREEIAQEVVITDPSRLLMELSARVRSAIGDDSLDAVIKEMLATDPVIGGGGMAISLLPTEKEEKKLAQIKEAIFMELYQDFVKNTFSSATVADNGMKTFTFKPAYIESLSPRQKKLLAPSIRLSGFIEKIRLDEFTITPDFVVKYRPIPLAEKFDTKEEEIKNSLKKLMAANQPG